MAAPEIVGRGPRLRSVARTLRARRAVVAAFLVVCTFIWVAVFAEFLAGNSPVLGTLACAPGAPSQWVVLANVVPVQNTCSKQAIAQPHAPFARGLLPLLRDSAPVEVVPQAIGSVLMQTAMTFWLRLYMELAARWARQVWRQLCWFWSAAYWAVWAATMRVSSIVW
jgi:hypothetical protein